MTIGVSGTIQGVTRVQLDYNQLTFNVKPYKVFIDWANGVTSYINDSYTYDNAVDPLSTFSPLLSAESYTVIVPSSMSPYTVNPIVKIFYENGVIHTFNFSIMVIADNLIDMDMDVLDIQSTSNYRTIYNLQSSKNNMVFNAIDS